MRVESAQSSHRSTYSNTGVSVHDARLNSSRFFACCVHIQILMHPWMIGLVVDIGFNGTASDINTYIAMLVLWRSHKRKSAS